MPPKNKKPKVITK